MFSSLGAGDFLRGLIIFKIFQMPKFDWAMVTKTVDQLKLL